jgi:hypothetical protein
MMKFYFTLGLIVLSFWLGVLLQAQTPAPAPTPKYETTEVELLQLQLAQAHVQTAQLIANYAQDNLNRMGAEFNVTVTKIIKAHGWPDDTRIDSNLKFSEAPKPAPPPPPAKP